MEGGVRAAEEEAAVTEDEPPFEVSFMLDGKRSNLVPSALQVGRYALVSVDRNVTSLGREGRAFSGGWLLVHWQSGCTVVRTGEFRDGVWWADYVSAFGADVEVDDPDEAHRQILAGLPGDLLQYLTSNRGYCAGMPSFLTWRANLAEGGADGASASVEGA